MKPYRLSENAESDVEGIWEHIHAHDPAAALRVVAKIRDRFNFLSQSPESGSIREDISGGPRCFTVGSYVIYYQEHNEEVEIIRVLHGARDAISLLEGNS